MTRRLSAYMPMSTAADTISSMRSAINTKVPTNRMITINGVGKDLTSNDTWTVGDLRSDASYSNPSWLSSVAASKVTGMSAGAGISYANGVIANTSPDQTVSIAAGNGVGVSGTYPNFTISNTSTNQAVSLSAGVGIGITGSYPNFTIANTSTNQAISIASGSGIGVTGTYPNFTVSAVAPSQTNVSSYASGTNYTLTQTYAKVTFGTTSPAVTLPSAGTYLIFSNVKIEYVGLTSLLATTANFKLRRINNTAADIPNASTLFNVPVVTLLTQTAGDVDMAPIIYTTATTGDVIEMWGVRGANVSVGSVQVGEAALVAIKLY